MSASDDVAAIAARLTEAQREAVLALHGDDYKTWPEVRLRLMLDGLPRNGLRSLGDLGLAARTGPKGGWGPTALGLRVYAHLASASHSEQPRG